jgi:NifU-like protein involved in Fe-S cluster formation
VAEQSTTSLYSREILRLAMELPHGDHLTTPHGTASARAPVCGSEMTAEIVLTSDGNVEAVALQARACALGQASAALLRHWALGRPVQTLSETRSAFADYLSGKSDNPPDPAFAVWPCLHPRGIIRPATPPFCCLMTHYWPPRRK